MAYKRFRYIQPPQALSRPVLVDKFGMPRYWAVIWSALKSHDLELSTEAKKLRYIESLYTFADELHGNGYLDNALSQLDLSAIGDVLDVSSATEANWQTCLGFVKDIASRLSKGSIQSPNLARIDSKLHQLNTLYGQLRIQKTRRPDILRSLPAEVIAIVYELLNPDASNNPFKRQHTRWNVFLAFICMLHLGLRRGEVLLLPVNCVKSAHDERLKKMRFWINVNQTEDGEKHDRRYNKPGIKTADSIRQVPISEATARWIQIYAECSSRDLI